uniref:Ovule protein n=1 Tax=Angiostrongylus cantonensis TaxID=6313 RepID=A0A0K0D7Y1_ANGCA
MVQISISPLERKTKQLRTPLIMYYLFSKRLIGLILKFGRKYVNAKKLNKDIRKVNGNRKSTMYQVDIVNSRMYMLPFLFCW